MGKNRTYILLINSQLLSHLATKSLFVADERFELSTSPYESDVITYFTNQHLIGQTDGNRIRSTRATISYATITLQPCELYRGIDPRSSAYKAVASPFMLMEHVVENIGFEPIRIPCKGISFPISLIPHCSRYENRTHIIGVKVLYPTPFRRTDHLRRLKVMLL